MVEFGIIDEWEPASGRLVSWRASPGSVAHARSAPAHPTPPSHQQEDYLRSVYRDVRRRGLCVVTAELPGTLDRVLMTRAINAFLLRHDTFRSRFAIGPDGEISRHTVASGVVEFVSTDHGRRDAAAIRAHVRYETPGPFEWDCFTFGTVEREHTTTVYIAIDHLHTDGVAQYISCFDLARQYALAAGGAAVALPQPASHLAYCDRERRYTAGLSRFSPGVMKWVELVRGNDGELPSFSLDLGRADSDGNRSAHRTIQLFDSSGAAHFEQACRVSGGGFAAGIFAAAAMTERELIGSDYFFGMTPINTRTSPAEFLSVGWYASLVPVAFPMGRDASFARLVTCAQHAYESGSRLASVPFHRVLELLSADDGITVQRGWSTPMISYIDTRDFAGNEYFDAFSGGVYGGGEATSEVLVWINRMPDETLLSVIFPDTEVAHASVRRYVDVLKSVFAGVAAATSDTIESFVSVATAVVVLGDSVQDHLH
ncbi:condensation domain-containing protein [Nocardia brasiliensis]|uniref:condensation domain-containing protein n=1 Tax=Nocardia brasiliensis TaxID=37326 RepID=UPI003D8EA7C5